MFLIVPATAVAQGVCDRTPQVRDRLVRATEVSTCEEVTSEHLAGVTTLNLQRTHTESLQVHDFSGLSHLQILWLDHNALTALPVGIFSGLSELHGLGLSGNALTTLPVGIFNGLRALRHLFLDDNALTALPAGIFNGLSRLDGLDLSRNALTALPAGIFSGLSHLDGLYLSDNALTALPVGIFSGLSHLDGLGLSGNPLTALPAGIFNGLSHLERLGLTGISLTALPVGIFSGLSALEDLYLDRNFLTTLAEGSFTGLSRLKRLWLDGNALTTLPAGVFSGLNDLQFLYLNHNFLTTLPAGIFSGLIGLEGLSLSSNSLTTLPPGVFSELNNLESLSLGGNPFTTLPPGVFSGLGSLEELSLENNTLTTLPKGVFAGLSSLPSLTLEVPSLTTLPVEVFSGLSSIKNLTLANTSLTTLPVGIFSGLSGLDTLKIYGRTLTTLPAGIFSGLSSLRILDLFSNSLTNLPSGVFSGLSNLKQLYLYDNDLTTLSAGAFIGLANLESLSLQQNTLNTLPAEVFSGMKNLKWLSLNDNALTTLPVGAFIGLTNLEYLHLNNNALTTLPVGVFSDLSSMTDLTLYDNALTTLPAGTFSGLKSLIFLTLHNNALTTLSTGVFSGLSSLRSLYLNNNALTTLPAGIFSELSSLNGLELNDNVLTTLPAGVFSGLSSLNLLRLNDNSLTTLPAGIFSGLSSLGRLELKNNSLKTLPPGIFSGLRWLSFLWLHENRLKHLPAGIFIGLDRLVILKLDQNRLRGLPRGIFDDVLDSLGDWYGSYRRQVRGELSLDNDLKAMLAFHSTEQRASAGAGVRVRVLLSRPLSVAVRVPFSVGGGATAEDYKDLSPSPSEGLLFLAGETSTEVVFSLLDNKSSHGKTVTVTLGKLSEIGLRRSDGAGPEAPHLKADSFLKPPYHGSPQTLTHTVTIVPAGSTPDDPVPAPERDIFVPVILSSAGLNNSFFTSELTLTNRSSEPAVLNYTYTAHRGEGSGTSTDTLAPGRQRIQPNAIDYLNSLGIPIPGSGKRIGTLRVERVSGSSEVGIMARTTTAVPEGRAGLAYPGIPGDEGFQEAVYLCGLRQNQQDRSNVAFQNMGAPGEGAITIRTTVYSGEAADATARVLEDVTLEPGEFHQYSGPLGRVENGYVKVERVEGEAPFYAYGVINDQVNSDGSFVFPVTASSLEGKTWQTLPVIVETSDFTSELTVTNFSEEPRTLDFVYVSEQVKRDLNTTSFSMELEAGQQEIVPDVIDELRQRGVPGLGSTRGFYTGPLFVLAVDGEMSGVVIGARTGSKGGGGTYSVFYNAVPEGEGFSTEAWVDGLQQNEENRSNLALVNTGEVNDSPSVFHLEIYDGETGMLVETVVTKPIPARSWHQINRILGRASAETRQGYVRIEKVSGENPFLAYGVVNDGGAPGERSGDGAYVPARD